LAREVGPGRERRPVRRGCARLERLEQRHAALLVRQALRVLERQVQEARLERVQRAVEAGRERGLGRLEREAVVREGARAAAEQVPRELVERDHQRERRARGRAPGVERTARRAIRKSREARLDLAVHLGRAVEPEAHALGHGLRRVEVGPEPEREQLVRRLAHRSQVATISSRFALRATSSSRIPSGSEKNVA
jgi:hypothetical protein